MTPDIGNGIFEAGGAILAWRNAWQLRKDGEIRGVFWPIYVFYSGWGLWNLYYYPALGQWLSFYAGVVIVGGNLAWLWQAVALLRLRLKAAT